MEILQGVMTPKLDQILKEIRTMGDKTNASLAHLSDDLHKIADGHSAVVAERDRYKAALESADADKAAAVQAALDNDDSVDSAAIDQADAIIHDLVNQADNGGGLPSGDGDPGTPLDGEPQPVGDGP